MKTRVISRERLELNKQVILQQSASLKQQGVIPEPPFDKKQAMLKVVVDKITLNVDEEWFEIAGVIPGRYNINSEIERIPEDTDSLRQ